MELSKSFIRDKKHPLKKSNTDNFIIKYSNYCKKFDTRCKNVYVLELFEIEVVSLVRLGEKGKHLGLPTESGNPLEQFGEKSWS